MTKARPVTLDVKPERFSTVVRSALAQLAERRPVFHSEADMQHELAVELSRMDSELKIRLERPVRLPGYRVMNVDLLLHTDHASFALELKYPTAKLEAQLGTEEFLLKPQAAQDIRRYEILSDISRLEALCAAGIVCGGMSVTITNDRTLWSESRRTDTVDHLFRLHHGRRVEGSLTWATTASSGTTRGREAGINLRGTYDINWVDYSKIDGASRNAEFRMLIAEVRSFDPVGETEPD